VNPQRDMPEEAFRVHGLSFEFLSQQPLFTNVVDKLLIFLSDSPLVIHNAEFDMRFLNAELGAAGRARLPLERAIDTLAMARRKHPGASNSLDALCARYRIDSSRRVKHGALLDAQILAEVYGELKGGRQSALSLTEEIRGAKQTLAVYSFSRVERALTLLIDANEIDAHRRFLDGLGPAALWRSFMPQAQT
jgi:DNA polymerase-3 subunit epsilon